VQSKQKMENLAGPRLLQAFFEYATDGLVDTMNNSTKAALRLSCKNAKAFADGTVTTAEGPASALETILRCDWHLSKLFVAGDYSEDATFQPNDLTMLLHAVCSKFHTLQVLEVNSPPVLYNLPANIGQLSKLRTLEALDIQFSALPASVGELSSLERLELVNTFEEYSSKPWTNEDLAPLKQLTQLKYLKLGEVLVGQTFFPDWLGSCHFPVLEDLILGDGLESLPSSISNFSNLTALVVDHSDILEVPESIGCLEYLRKLVLGQKAWAISLPTSFSRLTTLEELDVETDMQSFAVVEHFHKLTNLRFVRAAEEVITPYPAFLWTFTSLQFLQLHGSVPLPDALGDLKNLEYLRLSGHEMEGLPETVGNLTSITTFELINCSRLLKLPDSIGNLKNLREIKIYSCNGLMTFPESLGQLQSLETLENNHVESLERLPPSIGKLRALKELIVNDAGELFLPESFADLVLDKPAKDCSLEHVAFGWGTKLVRNGPRVTLALHLLQARGVLRGQNGF
jgi:Leucine-rich repeat (LRR) protein